MKNASASTTGPRRILLVDADAFFVAVARQADPEGAGKTKLLIVGGNPGSRGVVCSASYECREYGVKSAMPIAKALSLCPDALCVPVPRNECKKASANIARILGSFTPLVQQSSIDEWFMDLTGTEALYNYEPLETTAQRIRDTVKQETQLNVSVGGGSSRLIAKMAVEDAKPSRKGNGVSCVTPGTESEWLACHLLQDIPMIGPETSRKLLNAGLRTVKNAQDAGTQKLVSVLGERSGNWLARRIHGIDDSPVRNSVIQKSCSREMTFSVDISSLETLERELLRLSVRVSSDIRVRKLKARTITVKLRDRSFTTCTARHTLQKPVSTDRAIYNAALGLFHDLRKKLTSPIRLIGISLSQFDLPHQAEQLSLFHVNNGRWQREYPMEKQKDQDLSKAVDQIRSRFGHSAIIPARLLSSRTDTGPAVEEE